MGKEKREKRNFKYFFGMPMIEVAKATNGEANDGKQ